MTQRRQCMDSFGRWTELFDLTLCCSYPTPDSIEHLVPGLASDPDGLDLLNQMLCYDPAGRISAADAMQHPYFQVE